ncbi:RDD family protein [Cryptosporangium phraense]|uniref:RDD family protein n=1 Tax=Cryptosporangium phraense TaxID=2593070 RepID=UPI001478250F|nr:RDD family protein [Cryptosporangium phraense]
MHQIEWVEVVPAHQPVPLVRRAGARAVDLGVWLGVTLAITRLTGSWIEAALLAAWTVGWLVLPRGATAGKRLFGLRVTRADGTPLTVGRAFTREAFLLVSIVIPMILVLVVLVMVNDPRRQGLHDKVADTLLHAST